MRCQLIITSDLKQVVFTPETPYEDSILGHFKAEEAKLEIKLGSFEDSGMYGNHYKAWHIDECRGGYLRKFEDTKSVILVIRETTNQGKE